LAFQLLSLGPLSRETITMIGSSCRALFLSLGLFASSASASAAPLVLDFEDLTPGQDVADHYFFSDGITFADAMALTEGDPFFPLSAFFTPRSGVNVVANVTAPTVVITFDVPLFSFTAFVGHLSDVTITAYSSVNAVLGTATLLDNTGVYESATLEDPFGGPFGDIARVEIDGVFADTFVIDDLSILFEEESQNPPPMPEPATLALMLGGAAMFGVRRLLMSSH
jgi:hypothetical protein